MNKIAPQSLKAADDKNAKALAVKKEPEKDKDEKILERAKKRFDHCITSESDNRKNALEDRKFLAGDQWPADVMAARMQDQKPCQTINKLKTFVHQVTNDIRQNRPAIHFSPVGDRGDPEAARMFAGLFRFVENDSNADVAYDTASGDAASSGLGYFRMVTERESEGSFNLVLKIKRIRNPFTVYLDQGHMEPDASDMKYAFVSETFPRAEFEDKWPDADPCNWDKAGIGETLKNWVTQDSVRVAEYYEVKTERKPIVALSNGWEGFKDDLSAETQSRIDRGEIDIEREGESECRTVKWYRITAKEILERRDWIGHWIPIFKVIGNEIDIEGKVDYSGIVRDAKGPQTMYNYIATQMTEVTCLVPKAPYIGAEGQFEGHEDKWGQANTRSYPYLEYRPVDLEGKPAPPPQRTQPPGVPAGLQQLLQNAEQDMRAVTGIRFDGTMSERLRDESGVALDALTQKGDLANFHYVDNLAMTMKHLGRCFIDAAPKVYDNRRVLTILREDGTEEKVQLDPTGTPGQSVKDAKGKTMPIFNPKVGKYGVKITIGPSFATKRIEATTKMIEFAKVFPQFAEAFSDLIAKNQDWPGGEELTTRLAKLVAQKYPGVMAPDMKDVPPQVQAMLSSMDMQLKQLMQERVQLLKQLNDQTADRAMEMDKINKDFEAKLLKVVADIETKTAATQEKAVASWNAHIGSRIETLGQDVQKLMVELSAPKEEPKPEPKPEPDTSHKDTLEAIDRMTGHFTEAIKHVAGSRPKSMKIERGPDGSAIGASYGDE